METPQAISKKYGDTSQEYLDHVAKRKTVLDELGKLWREQRDLQDDIPKNEDDLYGSESDNDN